VNAKPSKRERELVAQALESVGLGKRAGKTTIPAGMSRDQFLGEELEARRAILARFARTGGIVSDRRAKERAEEMMWRSLQQEHLGPELAAWDRANRADPMVELVEELDEQRHDAALDEVLDTWRDRRGRSHLFPREEG
jgi:hypothetical protein